MHIEARRLRWKRNDSVGGAFQPEELSRIVGRGEKVWPCAQLSGGGGCSLIRGTAADVTRDVQSGDRREESSRMVHGWCYS